MNYLHSLVNVLYIVAWVFIFSYILKLEKTGCECSKGWRRDFIKYYIAFIIVMAMATIAGLVNKQKMPTALLTLQFVVAVFFIGVVYQYIHDLRKQKCECSEHMARDVLEIVNYVQIFLIVFTILVVMHTMFMISKMPRINSKAK